MAARIKIRRDEAADWVVTNPVLHQGELGIEIDANRMKIGDGITAWNSLPYFAPAGSGDMLAVNNLSDVDNAGTARTNLGLGTAALEDTSAFDAAGAAAAAESASQPVDSDLTAIAALSTTPYGRALLTLANNAALLAIVGPAGTASGSTYLRGDGVWATPAVGGGGDLLAANNLSDVNNTATALSNLSGQPLDADLTAIAALATTAFGRSLLTAANAGALQAAIGLEIGVDIASAAQGALADTALQDVDISDINATGTPDGTSYLRGDGVWGTPAAGGGGDLLAANNLSDLDNAGTARTNLGLGTAATAASGDFATGAEGDLAATATQPGDLGTLAAQDDIAVPGDITATGTPSSSTFLRGDGAWASPAGGGGGDLLAANNLSDVDNAGTARTNLGVAIGSDVQAYDAVLDATTASFTTADETKLDGIEASADVTDTTNVTAAGALMDSEVTNLAQVKAFDSSDYAPAAGDDEVYGVGWNGATDYPTKNAVYDKIETVGDGSGFTYVEDESGGGPTATAFDESWFAPDTGATYVWFDDGLGGVWLETSSFSFPSGIDGGNAASTF